MTSAFYRTKVLALATECESLSPITPLPIGVARNGKFEFLMKALISSAAFPYPMPFPTMTSGDLAYLSKARVD